VLLLKVDMVVLTSAFILASLTLTALASREGSLRARHERTARKFQSRDSLYTLSQNYTGSDFLNTACVNFTAVVAAQS